MKIENEYLQEELQKKNVTNVENIKLISKTIKESDLENKNWNLVRINKDDIMTWMDIDNKAILTQDDIDNVIEELLK